MVAGTQSYGDFDWVFLDCFRTFIKDILLEHPITNSGASHPTTTEFFEKCSSKCKYSSPLHIFSAKVSYREYMGM